MTTALEGFEGSASRLGRFLPLGKTRYPLYRRLGGPQGHSGWVRKISTPPGFDPRTVQYVASRYTDWATPARPIPRNILYILHHSLKYETKFHTLITNFGSYISVVPLIFCLFSLQFILVFYHPFPVSCVMCYVHTQNLSKLLNAYKTFCCLFPSLQQQQQQASHQLRQHHSTQKRKGLLININFLLRKQLSVFQHKPIMFINCCTLKHETSEVPNSSIITEYIRQQKESSSVAEVPFGHAQLNLNASYFWRIQLPNFRRYYECLCRRGGGHSCK